MTQLVAIQAIATGLINRLKNGDYALNNGTLTRTDGQEAFASWNVLTQSGSVQVSVVANPEDGQLQCARITQTQSTAQRIGLIQTISTADSGDLRQAVMNLAGRLRYSAAANLRFAVLQYAGAADAMPVDVVNQWDSSTYAPGAFFVSTVSVVSIGVSRNTAGTWSSIPYIPVQVGGSATQIAVFVWTEDTLIQNGTLDLGLIQLSEGSVQPDYEHRPLILQQLLSGAATRTAPYIVADISTLRTQVWTAATAPTEIMLVRNWYANDATGFETFRYDATDTTSTDDGGLTIVTAGGLRFKRNWNRIAANGQWWGVTGNGTTSCGALLNTAMASLDAIGGGILLLPQGNIRCEVTVDNQYDRVVLVGVGRMRWHDGGSSVIGTQLFSVFTGTLHKIRSPHGASAPQRQGQGAMSLMLNGNEVATRVLEVDSSTMVNLSVYCTGSIGTDCVNFQCADTGQMAETSAIQNCHIDLFVRQIATAQANSHCVTMEGSGLGNFSFNFDVNITCEHKNGRALWAKSADQNIIRLRGFLTAGGTGQLLRADGPTVTVPTGCQYNQFNVAGTGVIYAEGTGDPGVTAGIWNTIEPDFGNATPEPTAGTNSYWASYGQKGDIGNLSGIGTILADSRASAIAQRANILTESALIYNSSDRHMVLRDQNGNSWGIRLVAATGNLNFVRLTGTGKLDLPDVTSLLINGAQVSYGAADSGGAGFKLLRVPN